MQRIGIVVGNISNIYRVFAGNTIYECHARGKFKNEDISPVVGDYVEIEVIDEVNLKAVINEIKTRTTYIKRPKLANISQLVLVISASHPKPDLLMLDKQLAFAEYLGISVIIVINKIDLDESIAKEIEKTYKDIGYKVILTNAKEGQGAEELKRELKNNISAFSGNSGVGKSTLINNIFGEVLTKEGNISIKNKKGKNTTTSTYLYEIEKDTFIADTPGFSTFDIYEMELENLEKYFIEFREFIKNCEYVGCSHVKEETCGIKEAVKNKKASQDRYDRYVKIYDDLKNRMEYKKW